MFCVTLYCSGANQASYIHLSKYSFKVFIVLSISSARYGDTYRYRRYARVAIPLFDWDNYINLLLTHVAGLEHGNE